MEIIAPHGLKDDGSVYEGTTYHVQIAPSNRAACKGKCRTKIAKGAVKFVSTSNRGDYPMAYGRKIACTTPLVLSKALKALGSLDKLFDASFPADLKEKTLAAFDRINKGEDLTDEDLLLDEEPGTVSLPEGAGQKRKAKPAPKKKAKKTKKTDEWDSDAESEDEQDNADGDY
jgi:hypothetical protein